MIHCNFKNKTQEFMSQVFIFTFFYFPEIFVVCNQHKIINVIIKYVLHNQEEVEVLTSVNQSILTVSFNLYEIPELKFDMIHCYRKHYDNQTNQLIVRFFFNDSGRSHVGRSYCNYTLRKPVFFRSIIKKTSRNLKFHI